MPCAVPMAVVCDVETQIPTDAVRDWNRTHFMVSPHVFDHRISGLLLICFHAFVCFSESCIFETCVSGFSSSDLFIFSLCSIC